MRPLIVLLTLFYLPLFTDAQAVILIEPDSISEIRENVDLSNEFESFALELYYSNNTNSIISTLWKNEFSENCPAEWDIATGDSFHTYIPGINEAIYPVTMDPMDSNFYLQQLIWPRSVAGCCDIRTIFFLEEDLDTPIDTAYFHIEINADGCLLSSTVKEEERIAHLYPTPAFHTIYIENDDLIQSLTIFNFTGKVYYEEDTNIASSLDISAWPAGMYLCSITSKSGAISLQKIVKSAN